MLINQHSWHFWNRLKKHNLLSLSLSLSACYSNKIYRSELFLLISFCFLLLHPQTKAPNKKASECKQPKTSSSSSPAACIRKPHPNQKTTKPNFLPYTHLNLPKSSTQEKLSVPLFMEKKKLPKHQNGENLGKGVSFTTNQRTKSQQNASKQKFKKKQQHLLHPSRVLQINQNLFLERRDTCTLSTYVDVYLVRERNERHLILYHLLLGNQTMEG